MAAGLPFVMNINSTALAQFAEWMGLRPEEGWEGVFTRDQALNAIPNGTRIEKCNSGETDRHRDGDLGTVLGSVEIPEDIRSVMGVNVTHFYFIEFDSLPRRAIGTASSRIRVHHESNPSV